MPAITKQIVFTTNRDELILPPRTLKQAADAYFALHLKSKSPAYRHWCHVRLAHLLDFLGMEMPIKQIKVWHLDLWITAVADEDELNKNNPYRQTVKGKRRSRATVNGYGRCVKAFWSWLGKRRYIDADPAAMLELPEPEETPPRAATKEEVRQLLIAARDNYPRDYAIIRLMQATGIRAAGVAGLRLQDISLEERWVLVREKGRGGNNKARYVPFDPRTADALRDYLKHGWPETKTDYVFLSVKGTSTPLTPHSLRQMLRRRSKEAGLNRVITPHMLRHYYGTRTAVLGGHLRFIQQTMGHNDIKTTTIYVRFNPVALREEYDRIYTPDVEIEANRSLM